MFFHGSLEFSSQRREETLAMHHSLIRFSGTSTVGENTTEAGSLFHCMNWNNSSVTTRPGSFGRLNLPRKMCRFWLSTRRLRSPSSIRFCQDTARNTSEYQYSSFLWNCVTHEVKEGNTVKILQETRSTYGHSSSILHGEEHRRCVRMIVKRYQMLAFVKTSWYSVQFSRQKSQ